LRGVSSFAALSRSPTTKYYGPVFCSLHPEIGVSAFEQRRKTGKKGRDGDAEGLITVLPRAGLLLHYRSVKSSGIFQNEG
jgi:hypothetical protein